MTCIVGLKYGGKVFMGCDSSSVDSWSIRKTQLPKIFVVEDFMIGYSSSFRMAQLLQYHLQIDKFEDDDILGQMVKKFIPAVRECLTDGGYTNIQNNEETGGEFLVAYKNNLFSVGADFQVNYFDDEFCSIGSGFYYALGAIQASYNILGSFSVDPAEVVLNALKVAGYFTPSVCGPFYVYEYGKGLVESGKFFGDHQENEFEMLKLEYEGLKREVEAAIELVSKVLNRF